jgi:hypothetical protein
MPAKILLAAAAALFLQSATAWSAQPTWDVSKNFSSTRNPNGTWRYYGNGTLLNQGGDSCGSVDKTGCPGWVNGESEPDLVGIIANNTGAGVSTNATTVLPSGFVDFDPQSGYASVQWVAQQSGLYSITGSFQGIDFDEVTHFVHVNLLGAQAPLFDASISSYGQSAPFSLQLTLTRGQTLAFVVQAGSALNNLSTGLSLKITLLPSN